jgi:hypothetical protein
MNCWYCSGTHLLERVDTTGGVFWVCQDCKATTTPPLPHLSAPLLVEEVVKDGGIDRHRHVLRVSKRVRKKTSHER